MTELASDASVAPVRLPSQRASLRLLHSGIDVNQFFATHLQAAVFPVAAAGAFYGWRALLVLVGVMASAAGALLLLRRVGSRGGELRLTYGLWMAALLGLSLPAHLATTETSGRPTYLWPIIPAAGIALAGALWLFARVGSSRVHPVAVVFLLITSTFGVSLNARSVLQRDRIFAGDVLDVPIVEPPRNAPIKEPWITAPPLHGVDAVLMRTAAVQLRDFTRGRAQLEQGWLTLDEVIRDRLPPLEDLIIGGQPGPIGASSAIAVIMGGLFLLYRGMIDYRVPLLIVIAAFVTFLVLPIPVVITENVPRWRWFAVTQPGVGWSWAITFANYELMAGPLLFVACFLATAPGVRPMTKPGRAIYAILVGVLAAVAQLYLSVSFGAYVAIVLVSPMTPLLDRWVRPRPLV
ncbi:MAG TPA: RnfABCDGE type electron transport complex subunit D [Tepidisphaeraceae bacterium]|nr:RnfABCDGE type electron transport complex subunit D [Tepidisphaeraceae bacterium]